MIPSLLGPKAAIPADPSGSFLANGDAAAEQSAFDAEVEVEPQDPLSDGRWPVWAMGPGISADRFAAGVERALAGEPRIDAVDGTSRSDRDSHAMGNPVVNRLQPDRVLSAGPLTGMTDAAGDDSVLSGNDAVSVMRTTQGSAKTGAINRLDAQELENLAAIPVDATEDGNSQAQPLPSIFAKDDMRVSDRRLAATSSPDRATPTNSLVTDPVGDQPLTGAIEGAVRYALSKSDPGREAPFRVPAPLLDPTRDAVPPDLTRPQGSRNAMTELMDHERASVHAVNTVPRVSALVSMRPDPAALAEYLAPESGQHLVADSDLLLEDGMPLDAELLPSVVETSRSHGRTSAFPAVGTLLPTSLPGAILGVVLAPVPGGVEIALSPVELGHLRIEIAPDGDMLRIVLSAERPETLDLLRRHADQLMAEVLQAGFSGASMSFGAWGGHKDQGEAAGSGQDPLLAEREASPIPMAALGRHSILPAHAGGLNLRL